MVAQKYLKNNQPALESSFILVSLVEQSVFKYLNLGHEVYRNRFK